MLMFILAIALFAAAVGLCAFAFWADRRPRATLEDLAYRLVGSGLLLLAAILVLLVWGVTRIELAHGAELPEQRPAPHGIGSWAAAKRVVRQVHAGHRRTLYCGCAYSAAGKVDLGSCGLAGLRSQRAKQMEVEHIVPASTLAGAHPAWRRGGRKACERDADCRRMIFDPRNLAPASGYINLRRLDDAYAELPGEAFPFGACPVKDVSGAFEPPDCVKGDVARVTLYMAWAYGLALPAAQAEMLAAWAARDPVSPWEAERERRIAERVGGGNPFLAGVEPDAAGACPWE